MPSSQVSLWESIKLSLQNFTDHYRNTNLHFYGTISLTSFAALSGLFPSPRTQSALRVLGALGLGITLAYNYMHGRPFGIDFSCTPTHLINGKREPDKIAERRNLSLIQGDETVIHGDVILSRLLREFEFEFDSSSGIQTELRTKPKKEHVYDVDDNLLKCSTISEQQFPITIEVYPAGSVEDVGRYHWLEIIDRKSGKILLSYDVINVDG